MKENFYFDNAATTLPKPENVYKFMDEFFRTHGVNPGRSGHQLAVEAESMIVETRRLLAEFFGYAGNPNRVTFSINATDSMNTALLGLLEPGDHMIITRMEHNAVLRPANHMERDNGVFVTRIPADSLGYVNPDDIRKSLQSNTRVVVVNHGSNVIGSLQDIRAIGEIVRESNAIFIVDTCQTAGVLPIEMDMWCIDILVYTGHKGLFGPMGVGGMIVADHVEIKQIKTGGTGVNSVSPFHPDEYPYRLEAGTVSIPGIAGLNAAQKWFAETGRAQNTSSDSHRELCHAAVKHIHETELIATTRLIDSFKSIPEVICYGPSHNDPRVSTLSINIGNLPAEQAAAMLDADYGICVRPGLHCAPIVHKDQGTLERNGTVRFAPGYFTDDEDITQAITGVASIAEFSVSSGSD
ncbi:MAG: cysteine desulfurase [Acidiferrobacteraceae bacterium]|nr:cysteine desulfurase [Acidiferrobacteraceae bacterium]